MKADTRNGQSCSIDKERRKWVPPANQGPIWMRIPTRAKAKMEIPPK